MAASLIGCFAGWSGCYQFPYFGYELDIVPTQHLDDPVVGEPVEPKPFGFPPRHDSQLLQLIQPLVQAVVQPPKECSR
jgi:hypothetical protein